MKKIRALIVDDESLAREGIRLLSQEDAAIEIIGECATGREAVTIIQAQAPDLLFLDVQMPEMNGFEALAQVGRERMPVVIFVTAYDRYALRAFEVQALDYLLKPFTDQRFHLALARAKAQIEQGQIKDLNQRLLALLAHYRSHQPTENESPPGAKPGSPETTAQQERFIIKSGGRVFFLRAEEIDWIEAADYYSLLHVGSKSHLLRETLSSLEARLDPQRFLRIHRSAIINLERVKELQPHRYGNYLVILRDGTRLELSRRRRETLQTMIRPTSK